MRCIHFRDFFRKSSHPRLAVTTLCLLVICQWFPAATVWGETPTETPTSAAANGEFRGIRLDDFTAEFHDLRQLEGPSFTEPYTSPIDFYLECWDEPYPFKSCRLVSGLEDGTDYSVKWEGWLYVPEFGKYTFVFENIDDGALLILDKEEIVEMGWNYPDPDTLPSPQERWLDAGWHQFEVSYEQRIHYVASFSLRWSGPGFEEEVIPLYGEHPTLDPPDAVSPTDWTMVLSLRPTFTWKETEADSYRLTLYEAFEHYSQPTRGARLHTFELPASQAELPCRTAGELPQGEVCFKPNQPGSNPPKYAFELTSGTTIETGAYFWQVEALDSDGEVIAHGAEGFFQIPSLGGEWDEALSEACKVDSPYNLPCNLNPMPENEYWNVYDDAFYRWGEAWDIPAVLIKAMTLGETASALGPRVLRGDPNQFPPDRAYLYEPYWNYVYYVEPWLEKMSWSGVGQIWMFNQDMDPKNNHPPQDPYKFPFDRKVDQSVPTSICWYAYNKHLGGPFSNLTVDTGLRHVLGCENLFSKKCSSGCPASSHPAQYRTAASYGLGQIVYMFHHWPLTDFSVYVRPGDPSGKVIPEQLYDPDLNLNFAGFLLDQRRCVYAPSLHADDTDFNNPSIRSGWETVFLFYNGGAKKDYGVVVVARSDLTQPESLIQQGGPFGIQYEAGARTCASTSSIQTATMTQRVQSSLQDATLQEETLLEKAAVDLRGEGPLVWVTVSALKDPVTGSVEGVIRIHEDEALQTLLWESMRLSDVHYTAVLRLADANGRPLLMVDWVSGPHATRTYLVEWNGSDYHLVPIFDSDGEAAEGLGSDGGGIIPFPNGSLVSIQQTYESPTERLFYVFTREPSGYRQVRDLLLDWSIEDTTAPQTHAVVEPQPNPAGWSRGPADVVLTATDDHEVLSITYALANSEETFVDTTSPASTVSIPLADARWTLTFQATDLHGNTETAQSIDILVDGTPPQTGTELKGTFANGSYVTPVEVTLEATDPLLGDGSEGSGVEQILLSLDGGATWQTNVAPFVVSNPGQNLLLYRSGDLAGNFEKEKSLSIPIAEELPTMNYRSIGTRYGTLFCEGKASVSAGSMTVTFSMDLPDSVGTGDKIILGTHGPGKEVLYILDRLSPNLVSVQAAPTKDHIDVPFRIHRAYLSIQSWENHRQGDLVAENRLEVGVCYSDGPFKRMFSLALATIDGSVADETHFLWLTAAEGHRHYGAAGKGVVLDGRNRTMMGIRIHDDFTRIDGLELKRFRRFHGAAAVVVGRARNVVLEQLLIHDFDSRWYGVAGIRGMPKSDFTVRNTVLYDGGSAGIWSVSPGSSAAIENCTIHGMEGRGIDEGRGYFTVVNTISMDNESADFDVVRGTQSHNLPTPATAHRPASTETASPTAHCDSIDPGAEDFHLKEGAAAIDSGTELELFFAIDIDDEERPIDAGWDMGADEFSARDWDGEDFYVGSFFGADHRNPFGTLGRPGGPFNFDFRASISSARPLMSPFFSIGFPGSLYSK